MDNQSITVTPVQAAYEIYELFRTGLVPMVTGSPGIGKSDIFRQLSLSHNLNLIDFRLSQADPTDLNGFPTINKETKKSFYAPPEMFPLEGEALPDKFDAAGTKIGQFAGHLLFLDEINSASNAVQAAAYKVTLDKMIGQRNLHSNLVIGCAGNLSTDRAIVNRMSTAMQSRVIHLILEVSVQDWIKWSYEHNIDYRVRAFIQFRPDLLHAFDPKHVDNTFPCPRTWHFLSRLIKDQPDIGDNRLAVVSGTVGQGAAYEFVGFCKLYGKLPTIQQIIAKPDTIDIPSQPDRLYAISSMIGVNAAIANISQLMKMLNRMPIEFQIIALQSAFKYDRSLLKAPSVQTWISTNAKELL